MIALLALLIAFSGRMAYAQAPDEITFNLRFLQAGPQAMGVLASNREAIRRGAASLEPFDRRDTTEAHLLKAGPRTGADIGRLIGQGALRELASVSLKARLGTEALWVVGGEDFLPSVPAGDVAPAAPLIDAIRQDFGLKLSLVGWRLEEGSVRIRARATTRAVDFGNSTERAGRFLPAIVSRRIDKYLDAAIGQSFVLTGTFDDGLLQKLSRVPDAARDRLLTAIDAERTARPETYLLLVITPERIEISPAD